MSRFRILVVLLMLLGLILPGFVLADIYRWDNGELIPGTEGITPGPGVDLSNWNSDSRNLHLADFGRGVDLQYASFSRSWLYNASFKNANLAHAAMDSATLRWANLTGANLTGTNLANVWLRSSNLSDANATGASFINANLEYATLTNADLTETNLTGAILSSATLSEADLSGAVVTEASFVNTTSRGFTLSQLASTSNYQTRDLQGISLGNNDLSGWDFSGQNLANTNLESSTLTNADLSGANLTNALLEFSTLTAASLTGTSLANANLNSATMTNADLSGADLSYAKLYSTTLTDAELSGATLTGATFHGVTDFTLEQLISTASYQAKDLSEIELSFNDLTNWDFNGQDLTEARFYDVSLRNANLSYANLTDALFEVGFPPEANETDLRNADLSHANLTGASFLPGFLNPYGINVQGVNFSGANLRNAYIQVSHLDEAFFSPETTYNQWTMFPSDFDPLVAELTFMESPIGDMDGDDRLNAADIDKLTTQFLYHTTPGGRLVAMFDVNDDGIVDRRDHLYWVHELKHTWLGDANLDGLFNSNDLIDVLAANTYEKGINAGWASGDFNADGHFNSNDLINAMGDGGYEKGPRPQPVPEPSSAVLLVTGIMTMRRRLGF